MDFVTWLRTQTNRDDMVGDIAEDVYGDQCMPRPATYQDALRHINTSHTPTALAKDALSAARVIYEHYADRHGWAT